MSDEDNMSKTSLAGFSEVDNLDPELIPEPLKPLLPHVRVWANEWERVRAERLAAAPRAEVASFVDEVGPHVQEIGKWFDSFKQIPQEAWAFFYLVRAHQEATNVLGERTDPGLRRLNSGSPELD